MTHPLTRNPNRTFTFDAPTPHSVWGDDKVQERIAYDLYRETHGGQFHPHDPRGRQRSKDSGPQLPPEMLATLAKALPALEKLVSSHEAAAKAKPAPAADMKAPTRKLGDFVFEDEAEPRPNAGDETPGSIDGPEKQPLGHDIYSMPEPKKRTLDSRVEHRKIGNWVLDDQPTHDQAEPRPIGHDIFAEKPVYRQLGSWCLDDTAPDVHPEDRARWL